jgi:hypothetical protein
MSFTSAFGNGDFGGRFPLIGQRGGERCIA